MTESEEARAIIVDTLQWVIDDLLFYSDEIEMGRMATRDAAQALRLAAAFFTLIKKIT